jgi:prevent-host-death family protein
MESATISQVKNGLSAFLRKVRAGQAVLILDRNQPVAVLQGVDADLAPDSRLTRLVQRGLVSRSPSADPLTVLTDPIPTSKSVVAALLEQRDNAR